MPIDRHPESPSRTARTDSASPFARWILALVLLPGTPAAAGTISVVGTPGIDGVQGNSFPIPTNGTDGTAGTAAVANATDPGVANEALASGGHGGKGGDGGSVFQAGQIGGNGGNGGGAGDATAIARTVGARTVRASALGGRGGSAGLGGSYWLPAPQAGLMGAIGGRGGDASATASAENVFTNPTSTDGLKVEATASGGSGGNARLQAGNGGAATAIASGIASGVGAASTNHEVRADARGASGQLLADDGDTHAEATGSTTFGRLVVLANAIGRDFNDFVTTALGQGADATARASGTHTGAGSLLVEAHALVGTVGDRTGSGSVRAEGIATNGADVEVWAELLSAGSSVVRDAVSGSTSGQLYLRQHVSADRFSKRSGNVVTSLDATNPGSGDLKVQLRAFGGDPKTSDGIGGDAAIEASSATAVGDVEIDAWAVSGARGRGELGLIRGVSTGGGDVDVRGQVASGAAGGIRVENVVDGETTGVLSLSQQAEGGYLYGGDADWPHPVESVLVRSKDLEALSLYSSASGAQARAEAVGENAGGSVSVTTRASGYQSYLPAIAGGDAVSLARGVTQGDAHDVRVGVGLVLGGQSAIGGAGYGTYGTERVSDGGRADSVSEGIARGDSGVRVYDFSTGGAGGNVLGDVGAQTGSRGGDATSRGFASNAGRSAIQVEALAEGGVGGRGIGAGQRSGEGGDASVSARGESTGGADIVVRAIARGGSGGQAGSSNDLSGRGGDATVQDVSGSTSGKLRIEARAEAGWGGRQMDGFFRAAGEAGTARLDLDVENEGGGALELIASASSFYGGAIAIDRVRGSSSTGADVTVDLSFGVTDARLIGAPTGAADPFRIENLVLGETSGVLRLRQAVSGGNPQGSASNVLRREGHHRGLALDADLYSNGSGIGESLTEAINHGGWAEARAESSAVGPLSTATAYATGVGPESTRARATSALGYADTVNPGDGATSLATAVSDGEGGAFSQASSSSGRSASTSAIANAYESGAGAVRAAIRRASGAVDRIEAWAFTRGADLDATKGDQPQPGPYGRNSALITSAPTTAQVDAIRPKHAELNELLTDTGSSSLVHAIGRWSTGNDGRPVESQAVELDIVLEPAAAPKDVLLAVFEQSSRNGGFTSLGFRIEVDGTPFGDEQRFGSLAEANAYFANLIGLGSIWPRSVAAPGIGADGSAPTIRAIFETTTSAYQSASFGLAVVVVPEPGTAVLVLLGLALLARRKGEVVARR